MYKAPLLCYIPEEDIISGIYHVFLRRGYLLDAHKQAVGVNVDSATQYIFDETAFHGLYYRAKFDNATLEDVRMDMSVDMIECNRKMHLVRPLEGSELW